MALVVEDGTGLVTAESYASVAEADARATAVGNTTWGPVTTANKEIHLRKAAEFMTDTFRLSWQGERVRSAQGLDFPRTYVYLEDYPVDSNSVPKDIKNAQIDLAFKLQANVVLVPDTERLEKKVKVDVIEVEYESFSQQGTLFNSVLNKLEPYFSARGGASARLFRS